MNAIVPRIRYPVSKPIHITCMEEEENEEIEEKAPKDEAEI